MTFQFTSKRVDPGARNDQPLSKATTSIQVQNLILGRDVAVDIAQLNETQLVLIHSYIRACDRGIDTSAADAEIANLF